MLAEVEAVKHLDNAVFVRVFAQDAFQKFGLYARIIGLLFPIFADFDRKGSPTVLHVDAAYYLTKCACIYDLLDQISIT